jgi:hypothetical protein
METRAMILEHVWDANADPFTNMVDGQVRFLRHKVDAGFGRKLLKTVHGCTGTSSKRTARIVEHSVANAPQGCGSAGRFSVVGQGGTASRHPAPLGMAARWKF